MEHLAARLKPCPFKTASKPSLTLAIGSRSHLWLPATAQRLIECGVVLQLGVPGLRKTQRRQEVLLLVILHFEEAGDAALEADVCQVGHLLVGVRLLLIFMRYKPRLVVADEAVGDLSECLLDSLLVLSSASSRCAQANLYWLLILPP